MSKTNECSDAYEDRISHLRSGLRMAKGHIDTLHAQLGLAPEGFIQTLLDEDGGLANTSQTDTPEGDS